MWHKTDIAPEHEQRIKYRDYAGITHVGIFCANAEDWRVCDLLGGITTLWCSIAEWQGNDPLLVDVRYQDFLVAEIDAELG